MENPGLTEGRAPYRELGPDGAVPSNVYIHYSDLKRS